MRFSFFLFVCLLLLLFIFKQRMSTCCVKLSLLKLSLIYYKGSVAGKLQYATDQAISCVVFVWDKSGMVHVFDGHL